MDANFLRSEVNYDPDTGLMTQRRRSMGIAIGAVRGSTSRNGYLRTRLYGKDYYIHRLAWLYMTGTWPSEVDHINGNKVDNRWCNLRDVSHNVNQHNHYAPRSDNKVGLRGVSKRWNRYRATLTHAGVTHSLGCYDTAEEAHRAYLEAKQKLLEKDYDISKKTKAS